jgi:uncharacterized protein (DUF1697 family)
MLYLAFLRGINVPGRSVPMERLRELFRELGYENVRSYIASGNIFFETPEPEGVPEPERRAELVTAIGDHLRERLGLEVAVCLRTVPEVERILAMDPFQGIEPTDDVRFCVVFTTRPIPALDLPMTSPKKDMTIVATTEREAFVVWHLIDGRPPAAKGFPERVLGEDATTRFFHTVAKILAAATKGARA